MVVIFIFWMVKTIAALYVQTPCPSTVCQAAPDSSSRPLVTTIRLKMSFWIDCKHSRGSKHLSKDRIKHFGFKHFVLRLVCDLLAWPCACLLVMDLTRDSPISNGRACRLRNAATKRRLYAKSEIRTSNFMGFAKLECWLSRSSI